MGKIILYIASSLDGYIARENGSVDFLDAFNDSGDDYGYKEFYDSVGTIIMGGSTYSEFGGSEKFKEYYKGKPIFVFSRKNSGKNETVTFVNEDVKEFVNKLDLIDSKNIWMLGGASILDEFLKNDLVDELIITVMPVLLGKGISLFRKGHVDKKLKLLNVKTHALDVVQMHYGNSSN